MLRLLIAIATMAAGAAALATTVASGSDSVATPAYVTAAAQQGDLLVTLSTTGTLAARVSVTVGSQLSGQVSELLVDFNDTVHAGQVLARLDPRTSEARVREAEASLLVAEARVALARAALERSETQVSAAERQVAEAAAFVDRARVMVDNAARTAERTARLRATQAAAAVEDAKAAHAVALADLRAAEARLGATEQGVLAAKAERRSAEAEIRHAEAAVGQQRAVVDQARLELERTYIRAPIDGMIIGRDVDVGQTVAASLESPTLFSIVEDLGKMRVVASVDEADISRVRVGQRAVFTVDAYPEQNFAAEVVEIRKAPRVVQGVVSYTVLFAAENPDALLMPGMTAIIHLVTDQATGTLQVPNAALRFRPSAVGTMAEAPEGGVVWILEADGSVSPVPVTLGISDGVTTQVLSEGLQPGQQVVLGVNNPPEASSFLAHLIGG